MDSERLLATLGAPAPAGLIDRIVDRWTTAAGPLGEVMVAFTRNGICYLRTVDSVGGDADEFRRAHQARFARPLAPAQRPPAGLLAALHSGNASQLRYDLAGLTAFERDVLDAAQRIPAGQTRPYGWIAREIGRPKAVRAVGTALGHNPVPVLIPCHRVTRADGDPGDYIFGASVKEQLLRAENVDLDEVRALARRRVHFLGSDTTRIVCYPTCAHARWITSAHRVGFSSVAAAIVAGYRPCQSCQPR